LGEASDRRPDVPAARARRRLLDEEALLARELPGYAAYRVRVRHRLVPRVW